MRQSLTPDPPTLVDAAFAAFPPTVRRTLLEVRDMVYEVAREDPRVGALTETLKWGEPAYLTQGSGSGSTIRLGISRGTGGAAIFLNCRTGLVDAIRDTFGDVFVYSGNREIGIPPDLSGVREPIRLCAALALTYHLRTRA